MSVFSQDIEFTDDDGVTSVDGSVDNIHYKHYRLSLTQHRWDDTTTEAQAFLSRRQAFRLVDSLSRWLNRAEAHDSSSEAARCRICTPRQS